MGSAARVARPSLVIQTSFLGDVVLTTPLLTYLATRGPVDVVTTSTSPRRASCASSGVVRTVSPKKDVWITSEEGLAAASC